jgi:oligopeptide/dipeptide ABC transporter ATP-binding protein
MPDIASPLGQCGFATRCLHAQEICRTATPDLYGTGAATTRCFAASPEHAVLWPQAPTAEDWRPEAGSPGGPVSPTAPAAARRPETDPAPDRARADGPLMTVEDLDVVFRGGRSGLGRRRAVRAVEGVSLTLNPATVLGIVGESGSGKTTLGHAIVKLLRPTHGRVIFEGTDLVGHGSAQRHGFRRRVQMIFQNPYSSLSPRMRIGDQITEPYRIHHVAPPARRPVEELLAQVNLPVSVAGAFPSQVSGGQARRVGIARALTCEPALVVADEPTSGLDQSAAAATLNLLSDLRDETDLAVVLISHSLPQVITIADEICVMYAGQIVERGTTTEVTAQPAHPYTQALLSLAPDPSPGRRITRRRLMVPGEVPSPDAPPDGCRFHPRCAFARDVCRTTAPPEVLVAGESHRAACHFAAEVAANTLTPTARP